MLITFKSDADGDVIMFGQIGRLMLKTLGKDPDDTRGIITVAQLDDAIARLREAIAQDKAEHDPAESFEAPEQEPGQAYPEPVIHFSQRAVPLLDMLLHSARHGVDVTWES
ncbi:MAG: hypothetical protein H6R19_664 [Proteobacteria bacterium]|nr:hypothetical protein [Pseudomonadota bacterium]